MFTADAVRALEGPDWLRARRAAAFDRFTATALPTEAEEVWRYSRISQLDLDQYRPAALEPFVPGDVPNDLKVVLDNLGEVAACLVLVNDHIAHRELDPA